MSADLAHIDYARAWDSMKLNRLILGRRGRHDGQRIGDVNGHCHGKTTVSLSTVPPVQPRTEAQENEAHQFEALGGQLLLEPERIEKGLEKLLERVYAYQQRAKRPALPPDVGARVVSELPEFFGSGTAASLKPQRAA